MIFDFTERHVLLITFITNKMFYDVLFYTSNASDYNMNSALSISSSSTILHTLSIFFFFYFIISHPRLSTSILSNEAPRQWLH